MLPIHDSRELRDASCKVVILEFLLFTLMMYCEANLEFLHPLKRVLLIQSFTRFFVLLYRDAHITQQSPAMQDEICQSREYTEDWTAPEWSPFSREFIQQTTNQDISLSCERFKKLIRQKQFRFSVPVTTYYRTAALRKLPIDSAHHAGVS